MSNLQTPLARQDCPTVSSHRRARRAGLAVAVAAAALAGTLASGVLVLRASSAAFSGSTSNGPQTYQAGTVTLSDDGQGSLYTSVANLSPGDTSTNCVKVDYSGSLPANVKLYATVASDTGLGGNVTFTIDQGTTGPAASRTCGTAPAFGGTVTNLATDVTATTLPTTYAGGYTCWTAASGDNRWYRITYTLDPATPDTGQGKQMDVTFTWRAQNT
jgi:hypothetical protein